ncbi:MAG: HNH endonuclease signature motif containing protein [Coleofasciculus sp. D1-CHI-01]|uniref:HNH endonuclease n=1 Tax=Coleofasciculus sp. D1-CHI-01 TaxID=3068482 RepID=UPI0032FB3CC9
MPSDYERIPTALRQEIAQRAKHRCEYCRCPDEFSPDSFTVDHIKPRQLGGATTTENLAWACFGCNGRKYTRTVYPDPQTGQEIALFNPRQQNWTEHFDWSEDLTQLLGPTPCGRATIAALALNRPGVVNLRRLLILAGLHPPNQ